MNEGIDRVVLSIFKTFNETQPDHLVDFNSLLNQDVKIIDSTSHLYKSTSTHHSQQFKLATLEEAAQGNLPDFTYEMILFNRKISTSNELQYFSNFAQLSYHNQPTFNNIKNLPFIALHKSGAKSQITSHAITVGTIFKLGTIVFKVIDTHLQQNNLQQKFSFQQNLVGQQREQNHSQGREPNYRNGRGPSNCIGTCRICLMQDDGRDMEEQLISVCDCKGSCKFVHISCLKTWICSKVQRNESESIVSYSLAKLECEICKKRLPFQIKTKKATHNLVQLQKPRSTYLVLEKINEESQQRIIYVMVFKKQKISMGRGFSNDLRILDISISRVHASITFDGSAFRLNDEGSKYGSLILLERELRIKQRINICYRSKVYKFEGIKWRKMIK